MEDLTGKTFGKLRVLKRSRRKYFTTWLWICRCTCKKVRSFPTNELKRGRATHCGCSHRNKTHGESHSSTEYIAWKNMLARCYNKRHPHYKDYGKRGIAVSMRWWKFENFLEDMGRCPPNLTLDRKNNDGHYYKRNCRWASRKIQANNRRNSKRK